MQGMQLLIAFLTIMTPTAESRASCMNCQGILPIFRSFTLEHTRAGVFQLRKYSLRGMNLIPRWPDAAKRGGNIVNCVAKMYALVILTTAAADDAAGQIRGMAQHYEQNFDRAI